MIPDELPILLRPATADDYPYILASWSREYHKVHPFNLIPNNIYIQDQTKTINNILNKCTTVVACIEDDPYQIVGYLIAQSFDDQNIILHWGNVKGIFRRLGVMKTLLASYQHENKNIICSHYFDLFKKLKERYHLIYDPTILKEIL